MKSTKQLQIKVTLPPELHSQYVALVLSETGGELNLSSFTRGLIRKFINKKNKKWNTKYFYQMKNLFFN